MTVYTCFSSVAFEEAFDGVIGVHGNILWRKMRESARLLKLGLMDGDCSVP